MALGKIIDSPLPSEDECMDIFNLLDTNGDEVIDKQEMRVLL
jgi:Ca2+-binding EF-hand superfamily protein